MQEPSERTNQRGKQSAGKVRWLTTIEDWVILDNQLISNGMLLSIVSGVDDSESNPREYTKMRGGLGAFHFRLFIIPAVTLVVSRVVFYMSTLYTSDDAFITYRYARNIVSGLGFVYNAGERVQGFSSPLYTLVLAACATITGPGYISAISRYLGLAADLCSLYFLWKIFSRHAMVVRAIVATAFILYPKMVLIGISGMEAPVVVALMLMSWDALEKRNVAVAFFLFGLLLLVRLDTGLWCALCFVLMIRSGMIKTDAHLSKMATLPVLMYSAWVIFCLTYFGSWVPNSVIAKEVSWHHLFPAFDPVRVMLGYLPFHGLTVLPEGVWTVLMILLCVPVLLEGFALYRERSTYLVFPMFFILYNFLFGFGRVLIPDWYYYPGYMAYLVSTGMWLARVWKVIPAKVGMIANGVIPVAFATLLVVLFYMGITRWSKSLGGLFIRQNQALGIWLRNNATPGSRVLVEPIGYVGWESNLVIDDYIGIVSPQIISYRLRFPESDRWYLSFLREQHPDYVVQRNWEFSRNKLFHGHKDGMFDSDEDRQWFANHYTLVDWNPRAAEEDTVYLVLFRAIP
jgi:hypothetical protein